jgi:hypothetical protein
MLKMRLVDDDALKYVRVDGYPFKLDFLLLRGFSPIHNDQQPIGMAPPVFLSFVLFLPQNLP